MKFLNGIFTVVGYFIVLSIQVLIPSILIRTAVFRLFGYTLDMLGLYFLMIGIITFRLFVWTKDSELE